MANSIIPFSRELAQQLIDSSERFPIDFDLAWQWMGYSTKGNAKRRLDRFKEGRDFIKVDNLVNRPQGGGSKNCKYWLSIDCFKSLSMMAQTEQGDRVREYFLECERVAQSVTQKPLSQLELMQQSIATLIEHESRLASIEQQNTLLVEQNQLLTQKCALLEASLEAIEMETEANTVELDRYKNGHGRYYTISGWCNLHGYVKPLQECNMLGRKAVALCRIRNIIPQPVNDPRFGMVNSYPDSVLEELDFT